jgi:hypothetical protein
LCFLPHRQVLPALRLYSSRTRKTMHRSEGVYGRRRALHRQRQSDATERSTSHIQTLLQPHTMAHGTEELTRTRRLMITTKP